MDGCPFPWDVVDPTTAPEETSWEAEARLHIPERKLRAMAKELGTGLRRGKPFEPATLPPATWDRIGAACIEARKRSGPKPDLRARRRLATAGGESYRAAAERLGVDEASLRSRAIARKPSAQWDVLAEGLPRKAAR